MEHVDVLVVGAGLSGIGAAYHLQKTCPAKSYEIFEARSAIGGTWDLFRYPGVRSDSDMYTLGYPFRPWRDPKAIADGPSIREYICETAKEYGIDRKIRFNHRVCRASWSSSDALWTIEAETGPDSRTSLTCSFLYLCSGYYDYAAGYTPDWPGVEEFHGQVVHPQKWPGDLDYTGKRVVVIGSGATAVTLVPAMSEKAAHVTMLQRSPSYVITLPTQDVIANWLRRHLPTGIAYGLTRSKNVLLSMFFYILARRKPEVFKGMLLRNVRRQLGPDYDLKHFTPGYEPWDQRLCIVPDSDLFKSIRSGRASISTDGIERFTREGLALKSGEHLDADIIVTATGLVMRIASGLDLVVDGKPVDLSKTMVYKGMMFSDVPNLAFAIGYTNASWTLKCDLTAGYVSRMLNYMGDHGYAQATPRRTDPTVTDEPVIDFTSGYVQRALSTLPRQGSKKPWRVHQNYALDMMIMKYGSLDDGTMEFSRSALP